MKKKIVFDKVSEKNNYENEYNGTTRFNRTEFFLAHRLKIEDFQRAYPDIDWLRFINKIIHPVTRLSAEDHVVFPYDDFAEALAALINKTPKRCGCPLPQKTATFDF